MHSLKKFFDDPDWVLVEEIIHKYIDPLQDPSVIDTTQSAEDVKAQVIWNAKAYKALERFLSEARILKSRNINNNNNSFQ